MDFGSTSRGSNAVKEETRMRRLLRHMVDSKGRSFFCTVFLSSRTQVFDIDIYGELRVNDTVQLDKWGYVITD